MVNYSLSLHIPLHSPPLREVNYVISQTVLGLHALPWEAILAEIFCELFSCLLFLHKFYQFGLLFELLFAVFGFFGLAESAVYLYIQAFRILQEQICIHLFSFSSSF